MEDIKLHMIWASTIILVAAILTGGLTLYHLTMNKAAMENGYIKATLPGTPGAHWVKAEETSEEDVR